MRRLLVMAGVAALAIPTIAAAQPGCREAQHDNRVAGTVVGAGAGAAIGAAAAGPGDRGAGAVVGAIGGAVVGNAAGGASVSCQPAGYYDDQGVWHDGGYYDDRGVWRTASGYYDGDGAWVAGPPPGPAPAPSADTYSADVAYVGAPRDLTDREDFLEQRIQSGEDRGRISHYDADGDRSRLESIRDMQGRLRDEHDGLNEDDRTDLGGRLDDLNTSINAQSGE